MINHLLIHNMEIKTIGLASDHAGFALKQFVKKYLDEKAAAEAAAAEEAAEEAPAE